MKNQDDRSRLAGLVRAVTRLNALVAGVWFGAASYHTLSCLSLAATTDPHTATIPGRELLSAVEAFSTGLGLCSLVVLLAWIYHAMRRLNPDSTVARDSSFTPTWAVGWFLVPGANLVMPYFVVRQLLNGSRPGGQDAGGYVLSWWALTILSVVLLHFSTLSLSEALTLEAYALSCFTNVLASLLRLIAMLFTLRLVNMVETGWSRVVGGHRFSGGEAVTNA